MDYKTLELSRSQTVLSLLTGSVLVFTAAYLFYHSVLVAFILSCAAWYSPRLFRQVLLRKRRDRFKLQFKQALFSLTSSLAAGRSVENAFRAVTEDLALIYPHSSTEIVREFSLIRHRLENGEPLERSLLDLSSRAGIEEITQFADVFCIGKRAGGDLVDLVRQTSQVLSEKLDIKQELEVMVARKRLESRMMMAVPFVFLAFLGFAAPDYMAPLYEGFGYVVLTLAFIVLLACYAAIIHLMNIEV